MNAKQRRTQARKEKTGIRIEEVTRSFAWKLSLQRIGGPQYESVDFFQSAKAYCDPELKEQAAQQAYSFCKKVVLSDVREFIAAFKAEYGLQTTHAPEPHRAAQANARAYEQRQNGPTPTQQAVAAAKLSTDKLPEHLRPSHPLPKVNH